ncbi:MAG: type IV pili methyl-accepting chemotaxis transducer N-terminal domain-containing protein [Rhodoferax sp.]|uniref:type IV pili methyl-accepting chemotaxis transducer N-terminal domain-containing protein n=1 Tax=Rhodoferax sp. TaxID=50421 RepID=UPI002607B7A5|nr:type IV pili methyl-accepting chemotaxis transducer N-terminal domain-containing protein [Rhodoferax sp.]MDD5336675.1 type IV pili methyl-accepting chemotaxis transducer N-terminal domain-containing protein [Rhodoferax sp.]
MSSHPERWSLGSKLALVGLPFLLLALLATAATLWVSWQLDGGAAAVNEAGRMRMQSYRMALSIGTGETEALAAQADEFELSLRTLHSGDPERPLFVPWDGTVRARFATVEQDWRGFRSRWIDARPSVLRTLRSDTVDFASHIDAFVRSIEAHMARWTALLHLLQMSMLAMAVLGAAILIYTGYLFVLEPLGQLKQAMEQIQAGDFDARVESTTSDEFGTLADGFNGMAEHLQSMYRNLESRVQEKTAQLEEKHERLESLYEVTALVAKATSLDELAQGFAKSIARIAHADGVALRWSDQANQRYLMLAAQGLPASMVDGELCIDQGDCHCAVVSPAVGLRVIPIQSMNSPPLQHCAKAGFETVVNIPVHVHQRLMGEVDLFFHARVTPSGAERSLLEALSSHLAGAMENLRLNSLEKEAAVSQERHLLARELHDSIAQSLAFLKIQVQLMRDAVQSGNTVEIRQVLEEIDVGVRESYGDVRELLLHFRTRTNTEDIEPALATTLRKFEHQSAIKASLSMQGQGMPLSPDLQIQVLHIVQEALSNVRKHARASQVWLEVQQQPAWRFEVRDDGVGFTPETDQLDETHVGLRIMSERAQRIGAQLDVISTPGHGSSIILTLPLRPHPMTVQPRDSHAAH